MNKTRLVLLICVIFFSCNTSKKIVYMQDAVPAISETKVSLRNITIQPKDKLLIIVSSKTPELSSLFNIPIVSTPDTKNVLSSGQQQKFLSYTVDSQGEIDFPIFGNIAVQGLSKEELARTIKEKIKSENYIQDPIVTVEFANLKFSILGEIKAPGVYSIEGDRITILEAIGMAQDLTIYGKRDNVMVIREDGGKRTNYLIDLRSSEFFNSPAYYLQQNDVVYIQPNNVRAAQSTVNENSLRSVTLWTSIASLLTTIAVLIWK